MKTIQVQLAVTLGDEAAKALAELLAPALKQAMTDANERTETRRRQSQIALLDGQKPPEDLGLLVDNKQAAKLLKISERTLWELAHNDKIPPPIRIGAAVRWSLDVLKKWVEAGCPANTDFKPASPTS